MSLLDVDRLTMRFGGLTAVNAVDLSVEPGQIVSLIGPNGAGKTTVFNAVTGIYEPAAGEIRLQGRALRRRLTWRVVLACSLVALSTGCAALLLSLNFDRLWEAAIKRPYQTEGADFRWSDSARGAAAYFRGELVVQPSRGGRWQVVSSDGARVIATLPDRRTAWQRAADLNELASLPSVESRSAGGGKYRVASPRDGRTLAESDSRSDLDDLWFQLVELHSAGRARQRWAWSSLLVGLLLGGAGGYAVWNRARRTPDVIARSGVARTFQNIRLFQNMTVAENVLTAMDRHFRAGFFRLALRLPTVRREERDGARKAHELLGFVGLEEQALTLAKNLPYGDQRRLEIARALATEPKLILLDEPAAGMNPTESAELTRLIERIRRRGVTVMLIEHHMKVVMGISDRIAVLDYGSKIAEGTPEQVRGNPDVIRAYLGSEEVG